MTAYNRPKITVSEAAVRERKRWRKKLAVMWNRAGYVIRGFPAPEGATIHRKP